MLTKRRKTRAKRLMKKGSETMRMKIKLVKEGNKVKMMVKSRKTL